MIDPGVTIDGRQHAERHAHGDGEQQRERDQLERVGKEAGEVVGDGVAAAEREPEVAAQQAARVDDELRAERPIEPVLGAKRLHHRLGGVGAGGQAGRVAGDHVRDRERDAEQPEQQHAEREDAPGDVARHAIISR